MYTVVVLNKSKLEGYLNEHEGELYQVLVLPTGQFMVITKVVKRGRPRKEEEDAS